MTVVVFCGFILKFENFPSLYNINNEFCLLNNDEKLKTRCTELAMMIYRHINELKERLKSENLFITIEYVGNDEKIIIGSSINSEKLSFNEFKSKLSVISDYIDMSSITEEKYLINEVCHF